MGNIRNELRATLELGVPVVLAELGWMAMSAVDTLMVAPLGADALGGVSIGRAIFLGAAVLGMGLLFGLDTVVSFAWGRGRVAESRGWLVQGVHIAWMAGLTLAAGLWFVAPFADRLGLDPGVASQGVAYLRALALSLPPLLLYTAFRRYLQSIGLVRPVVFAMISANAINVIANWVLIFGHLGAPALGTAGAGWATFASSCYMALVLLIAIVLAERERGLSGVALGWRPDWIALRRLIGLGLPASLQLLAEVGVFAVATALAGRLGAIAIAAHQIALTAASLTFMVPFGLSSAAAVRVGQSLGRGDPSGAARAGTVALGIGAGFMALASIGFWSFPDSIVGGFTANIEIIRIGVPLLGIAAWFQLFDGLQVVATGALRGAGSTMTPFVCTLVAHWALGLPLGYWLAFVGGQGVVGLWVGLAFGLGAVGALLTVAWFLVARGLQERPVRDEALVDRA